MVQQALIINAIVLVAVLEADLGSHRKITKIRVLRPLDPGCRHRASLPQRPRHYRHRAHPRARSGGWGHRARAGGNGAHDGLPQPDDR